VPDADALADKVADLETRLAALEDERAVRQVLARYGFNADLGRTEEWVSLWAEDGVLDLDAATATDWPPVARGHDELRAVVTNPAVAARHTRTSEQTEGPAMVVYVDGDTATAEGYRTIFIREDDGGYRILMVSFARWTLVRTAGGWKIKECVRRPVGTEAQRDVFVRTRD